MPRMSAADKLSEYRLMVDALKDDIVKLFRVLDLAEVKQRRVTWNGYYRLLDMLPARLLPRGVRLRRQVRAGLPGAGAGPALREADLSDAALEGRAPTRLHLDAEPRVSRRHPGVAAEVGAEVQRRQRRLHSW